MMFNILIRNSEQFDRNLQHITFLNIFWRNRIRKGKVKGECMGSASPSCDFFQTLPPSKPMPPYALHLKMKPHLHLKNNSPLESEVVSRKWFPEKNPEKWETIINTCASIIKQRWKKMAEIPQERDFLTCTIRNLVRKVKQFVRKYYITVKHLNSRYRK